jgi:hypothetical protein
MLTTTPIKSESTNVSNPIKRERVSNEFIDYSAGSDEVVRSVKRPKLEDLGVARIQISTSTLKLTTNHGA